MELNFLFRYNSPNVNCWLTFYVWRLLRLFTFSELYENENGPARPLNVIIFEQCLLREQFRKLRIKIDSLRWPSVRISLIFVVLQVVIVELPPTPSKFHYIFNLKDLSRICAGMLLIDSKMFQLPRQFVRVWRNEFTRVICDRLVDDKVTSNASLFFPFLIFIGRHVGSESCSTSHWSWH